MQHKPKALFFDVFGTLTDWHSSISQALSARLTPLYGALDYGAMATSWRGRYQPSMEPIRQGDRSFVPLDQLHQENLKHVILAHGLPDLDDDLCRELAMAWRYLTPWPDVVAGLDALRQSFLLAPVSNGNVALMVVLARHAGFHFDMILGAEMAQNYKPMPDVYLRSAALIGLLPEECMMVAAHNDDLQAASALGLKTAFFPRLREYGPNQQTDLCAQGNYDLVADDLLDLAQQLLV